MERRLAAVMVADMAAYTRLMEMDEEGVLSRHKTYRREVIDPEIQSRGGRIIKTTGDGMLVEFRSVQDAVRTAMRVQDRCTRANAKARRTSASPTAWVSIWETWSTTKATSSATA